MSKEIEKTDPVEPEGAKPEDKPEDPTIETPAPADDEQLAEAGKKALAAERAARRKADKELADARAAIKEFEDRDKSEAEKTADRIAALEAENQNYRQTEQRREWAREVSDATGVPTAVVEALRGDSLEALQASAELVAPAYAKTDPAPVPEKPAAQPVPSIGEQPSTENVPLKDQIAAAEAGGDKALVAQLKAMQLGAISI